VLGSLQEGFGRVLIEALMHGLPVIAHQHPVMEYVIGGHGVLGDLRGPGELTRLLAQQMQETSDETAERSRWEYVERRFSWPVLAAEYGQMFDKAAGRFNNAKQMSRAQ